MKLSMKTVTLQDMVGRAIKGAGQNKQIPLTSLMLIEAKDNQLTLITTDMSNYLYIKQDMVVDNFYAVVQVEQFSKLVSKLTCEDVKLEIENGILTITGNGTYKIELPLDEVGEPINYPEPLSELTETNQDPTTINLSTIKTILNTNKAALAITDELPCYKGYYVGDRVISTDTYKICGLNVKLFDTPVLIAPDTMNLLDIMTDEKISVDILDDIIIFTTKDCIVYSHKMEGIEDYAVDAINGLIDEEFESSCKLHKNDLLAALDRISLFVGTYDKKSITLNFTKDGLTISSKQSNGVEKLPYMESENFKDYICEIDIIMFGQQIKANAADVIEIQYGNDRSIKMIDGNVIQITALLGE